MHLKSIILLLPILLVACVEDAKLILPKAETPRLVVNSWFSPQYSWELYLSHTYAVGDSGDHWVENARIFLFENGLRIDSFLHQSEGRYLTAFRAQAGRKYRIQALAEGYPTIEASDSVPALVPIIEASFSYLLEEARVSFIDPKEIDNYYQIGPPNTNVPDPIINAELYTGFNPYGDFFSDQLIAGESYTYKASQGINTLGVDPKEQYEICETTPCYFYLRSLSADLYAFHKSWIQHSFNIRSQSVYGLPYLTQPLNVHSNVQNGYGIFAAFNIDSAIVEVK